MFGFSDMQSTGADYNWTHINTVAWASDELMCRAHQHGARAIMAAPFFDFDKTDISQWTWHFDGVVFDYESPTVDETAFLWP